MKLTGYLFCLSLVAAGVTPAAAEPEVFLPLNPVNASCKPTWYPLRLNFSTGGYVNLEPGKGIVIEDKKIVSLHYRTGQYVPLFDVDNFRGAICNFSECGDPSILLTCDGVGPSKSVLFKRKVMRHRRIRQQ